MLEKFLRKIQKRIILECFSKKFSNQSTIFRAFRRKPQILGKILRKYWNFWRKFNRNNYFPPIFGNLFLKIELCKITSDFYKRFSLAGAFSCFPLLFLVLIIRVYLKCYLKFSHLKFRYLKIFSNYWVGAFSFWGQQNIAHISANLTYNSNPIETIGAARGEHRETSPPPIENNCCRKMVLFQRLYF